MAQSGYTPIILFNSGTTGHVPTTGNLTLGELAINYTDGKIFYNNGSAIVQYSPPAITLAATSGTINGVVIGGTTPAAATVTSLTVNSTISGSGITSLFASPPPIGSTAPNTLAGLSLTIGSGVNGVLMETLVGSGAFALYSGSVTPSATNYSLAFNSTTTLNSPSGGITNLSVNSAAIISATADTATIKGTVLGGNAAAGQIGEYLTVNQTLISFSNSTPTNIASLVLSAGDWDVFGTGTIQGASTTTFTQLSMGLSVTSGSLTGQDWTYSQVAATPAGITMSQVMPTIRVSSTVSTTIYAVAYANFSVSTAQAAANIQARRVR